MTTTDTLPACAPIPPEQDPRQLAHTQADWLVKLATDSTAGRLGVFGPRDARALGALVRKGLATKGAQGWEITAAGRERCKSIY